MGNKIQKNKRKAMLFAKTLMISLTIFALLTCGGFVVFRSLVRPPKIPAPPSTLPEPQVSAAVTPEEEDKLVGGGLHAPEGFTGEDRKDEFFTFLIFGTDDGINTDTIMVASYDGVNKEAHIISIPRDSKVNVKRNVKKINAAYSAGAIDDGIDGGISQLKRELRTVIGFVPDFYVCVDFDAFIRIVNAVGGVEVYAPMDMVYNDLSISIKEGRQVLRGEEALKFARYRQGKVTISDYQRMENQQAVIKALLDRLLRPSSILKIPEFIDIFIDNVYTDIKPEHMLWFADQLNKVRGSDALKTHTLPTSGTSGLPYYYEYLDESAILELINNTVNPYKKNIRGTDLDIAGDY